MSPSCDVLVVGASVASGALISQLREDGVGDRVLVVDQDPDAPYDRPPLSKGFLAEDSDRPTAPWWHDGCELMRGRATSFDTASSTVRVARKGTADTAVRAEHIVIATGAAPVRLPGAPPGVLSLRTAEDARAIRSRTHPGCRVVILGAGTIGTELASTLSSTGADVTLLDVAERPLDRFLGGHLGDAAAAWIRQGNVSLHLGSRMTSVVEEERHYRVVTGSFDVPADLVINALGAQPATGWLTASEVDISDGVRCDSEGTALDTSGTPLGNVHAIGDVAAWEGSGSGPQRWQDWTHAQRQGRNVARHLLGASPVHKIDAEPAYFWSHQFGRRIQVLGTPDRGATLVQHVDDPDRKAAFYTLERGTEVVASIGVNTPREFAMAMRKSMQAG